MCLLLPKNNELAEMFKSQYLVSILLTSMKYILKSLND